jgi:dipeptidyl aminopeptidase/acylaminoacyl peptidase
MIDKYRFLPLLACAAVLIATRTGLQAAEPSDSRRPAAIVTEHVPAIPGDLIERLRPYQNVRTADFEGWDPGGRGMLVRTRFGNASQLHRVYEPGGRREQVTFYEEPVSGRFLPSESETYLLSIARGGDENYQIYSQHQGLSTLLTNGTSRCLLGPVAESGDFFVYAANVRNPQDMDLFRGDPRSPGQATELLRVSNESWDTHDLSPDGKRLLVSRYVSINESHPAIIDVETRTLTPLPPPPGNLPAKVAYDHLRFAPDGRSVLLGCDARGEFSSLARVELNGNRWTWLSADIPWDVDAIEVQPKSGRIAFTVNADGASRLYLLEGDRPRPLEVPLGIIGGLEFSPDGTELGFTLARPNATGDTFSIRLDDGRLTQWTVSEAGGLDPSQFVAPQRIAFKSFDGREIPAYVFQSRRASREHPAPVLVNIHGGPEGQYRPTFSEQDQFLLSELGIAVIRPNVRGSAGYGKTYLQLDNAEKREDSVRDIGALLDWIARQPELDASRVAVYGGSYGGYMVLASLTHFPDRLRAGIDVVGIASFTTFLANTSAYRRDLRRAEYGDDRDPTMQAVFARINPMSNAHKIRSSLLVAHGRNDPRVPFSEAEQIAPIVRKNGVDVWTVYADNEGHGFARRDNRDYLNAAVVLFLQQHLVGDRPAQP